MKKLAVLILSALALSACSSSTADLANSKSCSSANFADNECPANEETFTPDTDEIFVSVELSHSPDTTEVTFDWYYLDNNEFIDSVTLTPEITDAVLYSSLEKPPIEGGWPVGEYEVKMTMNWDNFEPISHKFSVVE